MGSACHGMGTPPNSAENTNTQPCSSSHEPVLLSARTGINGSTHATSAHRGRNVVASTSPCKASNDSDDERCQGAPSAPLALPTLATPSLLQDTEAADRRILQDGGDVVGASAGIHLSENSFGVESANILFRGAALPKLFSGGYANPLSSGSSRPVAVHQNADHLQMTGFSSSSDAVERHASSAPTISTDDSSITKSSAATSHSCSAVSKLSALAGDTSGVSVPRCKGAVVKVVSLDTTLTSSQEADSATYIAVSQVEKDSAHSRGPAAQPFHPSLASANFLYSDGLTKLPPASASCSADQIERHSLLALEASRQVDCRDLPLEIETVMKSTTSLVGAVDRLELAL